MVKGGFGSYNTGMTSPSASTTSAGGPAFDTVTMRLLALHLAGDHVGPVTLNALLQHFGSYEAVFAASDRELRSVQGVGPERAKALRASENLDPAESELRRCAEVGARLLPLGDPDYPELLSEIYAPPLFLYVLGDAACLRQFCVAIVGSRRCNQYGKLQAHKFALALAGAGATVVSGLARGIDSCAHRGALDGYGKTAAVLGCGIDRMYPPENAQLRDAIVAGGGAVVSEFPLGSTPTAGNFPKRNRIISGLSRGTLVVQAHARSGALLTANWANDQNRDVFVIPDRIDTNYSQGSHELIQRGARLVTSMEDILSEYPEVFGNAAAEAGGGAEGDDDAPGGVVLPEAQRVLYKLITAEEIHVDDLVEQSNLSAPDVNAALLKLQMSGLVRSLPGMYYQRM